MFVFLGVIKFVCGLIGFAIGGTIFVTIMRYLLGIFIKDKNKCILISMVIFFVAMIISIPQMIKDLEISMIISFIVGIILLAVSIIAFRYHINSEAQKEKDRIEKTITQDDLMKK